jgi:hypothetical protein
MQSHCLPHFQAWQAKLRSRHDAIALHACDLGPNPAQRSRRYVPLVFVGSRPISSQILNAARFLQERMDISCRCVSAAGTSPKPGSMRSPGIDVCLGDADELVAGQVAI